MTGPEALDVARDGVVTLIQVASPLMLVGLVVGLAVGVIQALTQIQFYAGLGVLARLMPQLQIFFLGMPAGILLGFAILLLVLAPLMTWFLGAVETTAARFVLH